MRTRTQRITRTEIKRRQDEIGRLYPCEVAPPTKMTDPDRYFTSNPGVMRLAEDMMSQMPAALFFSGTYRTAPRGRDAARVALADFERCVRNAGYRGRFFAVAHRNHDDGGVHVHAICDWDPQIDVIGKAWGAAHGIWKAGVADPGGFFYVAKRACDPSERTYTLARPACETDGLVA